MSLISDFAGHVAALSSVDRAIDREPVTIKAVVAVIDNGEGIALTVNDGQDDLALGGDRYRKPTEIQIDIYASTYIRLREMKDQIIDTYHGVSLTIGETTFHKMTVTFSSESAATLNDTVYRAIVTLEVIT